MRSSLSDGLETEDDLASLRRPHIKAVDLTERRSGDDKPRE
jgi:hypothetical protein